MLGPGLELAVDPFTGDDPKTDQNPPDQWLSYIILWARGELVMSGLVQTLAVWVTMGVDDDDDADAGGNHKKRERERRAQRKMCVYKSHLTSTTDTDMEWCSVNCVYILFMEEREKRGERKREEEEVDGG